MVYRSFRYMIFKSKCFDIFDTRIYAINDLDSELYSIDIHREILEFQTKPFVLLEHCERVFFNLDVFDENWWFVIPYTQRGKCFFFFFNVHVVIVALG
jgi:hypothetical protein